MGSYPIGSTNFKLITMLLRFEDKVYIKQWMNFRKPTLKDMVQDDGFYIDCGICRITINKDIIQK